MALTTDQLRVLQTFGRSPEGRMVVAVLKDRQAEHDVALRRRAGDELLRLQGRAQECEDVIALLLGASPAASQQQRPGQVGRAGARALT